MIPLDRAYELMEIVLNFPNLRILFCGDENQLPCIGIGNFFGDIIEASKTIPEIKLTTLTTIHRYGKESKIPEIAREIERGSIWIF